MKEFVGASLAQWGSFHWGNHRIGWFYCPWERNTRTPLCMFGELDIETECFLQRRYHHWRCYQGFPYKVLVVSWDMNPWNIGKYPTSPSAEEKKTSIRMFPLRILWIENQMNLTELCPFWPSKEYTYYCYLARFAKRRIAKVKGRGEEPEPNGVFANVCNILAV